MKYSKSRPKIIASGVLDALGTVLYAGVAVACFVIGVVLMNTDPSESDGTLDGAIGAGASAIAIGLAGVIVIMLGVICSCALVFSLVSTIISLKSVLKRGQDSTSKNEPSAFAKQSLLLQIAKLTLFR